MPTAPTTAAKANTEAAIATRQLSAAEITTLLRGENAIDDEGQTFNRMKVSGSTFEAGDEVYPYNMKTDAPAFTARIIQPPEQYQGFWFTPEAADFAERPEIGNHMCKSYYDEPSQARKYAEDGASCDACPFHPFKTPPAGFNGKCSWKGDLQLQIIPDDGVLKGDETTWTLTLSTTSMIELRGTRKEPVRGTVSDLNFMQKLSNFAQEHMVEWGFTTPEEAIRAALTSYNLGGVAAEFRVLKATNDKGDRTWGVVSLTPVYVETNFDEAPVQLEAGDEPVADATEDVPF